MDLNRLLEIEERLNNTTSGKWKALNIPYNNIDDPEIISEDGTYICQTVYDMQSKTQIHNVNEDTIFITNAKEDITFLLKEIKMLLNKN